MSTLEKAASDFITALTNLVNSGHEGAQDLITTSKHLAPEAWRIAVYQVKLQAICTMTSWLLFAIIFGVVATIIFKQAKKSDKNKGALLLIAVPIGLASLGNIAASLSCVPRLLNPEYTAATNIISALKPVCKTQ